MIASHTVDNGNILIREFKIAKFVTLNRPRALNAFSLGMVTGLIPFYKKWQSEGNCVIVVDSSSPKVFSAGGDVKSIVCDSPKGVSQKFFRECYGLNQFLHQLMPVHKIPHVSILNGITIGGGLGYAVQGSHRICTENTAAAMPECGIGFFPDVCASYFLPRLKPRCIGYYMALTGNSLSGADVVRCGLGTNYVSSGKLDTLMSTLQQLEAVEDLQSVVNSAESTIEEGRFDFATDNEMSLLHDVFHQRENVEDVLNALSGHPNQEFTNPIMMKMLQNSPTSMKVTWELLRRATDERVTLTYADHVKLNYMLSQNFLKLTSDFREGVRARLVDKCNQPNWMPSALSDLYDEKVQMFFSSSEDNEK
ncbi:3-hydroxyisobutyryl-CoA hydrolase mitochondrial-like protein [Perkinsela sp. CCAP 1560/4]|nr:3-hydroxyisobutyryl-CoA hydrolase mitochondrial-like protein [Perkinsela sp. CCAP 1560/4]|eukprot:KNH09386.1 3-hydroxyisobutyryl-CoA hydrolase mitochondrial-like protein [Perkinsela sp. CCAP 1560/4]